MSDSQNKAKLDPSKAYLMAGLVDYSEAAVVSRTVIKNQAGPLLCSHLTKARSALPDSNYFLTNLQ